ncbi:protein-L-histidine N-pros-methyltransferase isoform X2 [Centruroides vittatus]|uniref:protein-L-histidine N-pros-methyltransferase isoform X2 n=1 Tax=Centruroides vittatus TaxID=120091 RepID=UPI003510CEA1
MASIQRPYFRSMLAQSLYDRMVKEQHLRNFDRSQWYRCDLDRVTADLRDLYIAFDCDKDTNAFLETCYEKSDWFFVQVFHSLAKAFLCWFMTQTSINGFLGRGSTFVFSQSQFLQLLGVASDWHSEALLDLGAGDGSVTQVMASLFDTVHVTEISSVMQRILTKKGYRILDVNKWAEESKKYDVVSCLNLLDRCDKPITLLNQIKSKLKPTTGRLIIALVLPLSQYVEVVDCITLLSVATSLIMWIQTKHMCFGGFALSMQQQ